MLDLDCLPRSIGQIALDFVERGTTPEPLTKLRIHIHTAGPPPHILLILGAFIIE